jgi:hypothetical protein
MALMLPAGLMELLSAELCSPIEAVTMACQCNLTHAKGFLVSAGQLFEFCFDRERQAVQIWPRLQLQRHSMQQA